MVRRFFDIALFSTSLCVNFPRCLQKKLNLGFDNAIQDHWKNSNFHLLSSKSRL